MWLNEKELESNSVKLVPMREEHADSLVSAASDGKLWELWFTSVPDKNSVKTYIRHALDTQRKGLALPFIVMDKASNKIIGTTRFCNADIPNKRVEIGYTWYAESFQRTSVNTECKHLLLSHAFEQLETIAVEFRTHWHNLASRNAITRLGAKQDGVLRHHRIMADGSYRDTVIFSILNSEWPAVKADLEFKLAHHP